MLVLCGHSLAIQLLIRAKLRGGSRYTFVGTELTSGRYTCICGSVYGNQAMIAVRFSILARLCTQSRGACRCKSCHKIA